MSNLYIRENQGFNIVIKKGAEAPVVETYGETQVINLLVSPWKSKKEQAAYKKAVQKGENYQESPPFFIKSFGKNADILAVLATRRNEQGKLSSFTANGYLKTSSYKDKQTEQIKYSTDIILIDVKEYFAKSSKDSQDAEQIDEDESLPMSE